MGLISRLLGRRQDDAPGTLVHEACGGAIRVFGVPAGPEWCAQEDQREGDGFVLDVLKYVLEAEPFPLTLSAKVYTLQAEEGPPEDPVATAWAEVFGELFVAPPDVNTNASEQTTMRILLKAMEARITGVGKQGVPMFIRERRAVRDQQQFIVTAYGPAQLCEVHAAMIDAWFQNVAFQTS